MIYLNLSSRFNSLPKTASAIVIFQKSLEDTMKRLFVTLFAMLMAMSTAYAKEMVIATINTAKISPFLRQMQMEEIKKLRMQYDTPEIQALKKKLSMSREKLADTNQKLSKEDRESLKNTIQDINKEMRTKMMNLRTKVAQSGRDLRKDLSSRFKDVVKKVAQKRGATEVFPDNALLYSETSMDITDDVIAELKNQSSN